MSGTWLASLMPPFWRKIKSSSTIDFPLVLRLVNYINNSKQQHQKRKIRWSSSSVSTVPFLSWRSARQVVIFFLLFSFFPFTAFLQFCSWQSLAAWQFYCTPSLRITTRWNHCLKFGSQWDMACMLMTAQGGNYTQAELVPSLHASVSYRNSSLLRAVGGLHVITSLCVQQTEVTKNNFFWSWELMHLKGTGSGRSSVGG